MPELPEVEAICRKLRKELPSTIIRSVDVFRPRATHPQTPEALQNAIGHGIAGVLRRGKNILLPLTGDITLRIHLGMTGNLYVIPDARFYASTARVLFGLEDEHGLVLDDRRLLGSVQIYTNDELEQRLATLGIDPFSKTFTTEWLVEASRGSTKPAKVFLMDQQHIAGLGNIYAAESLFRARINPTQPMARIRKDKVVILHGAIREVLRVAIRNAQRAYSEPGYLEDQDLFVYGRKGEPCRICGTRIKRIEQVGRSTFYCPRCQR